MAENFTFDGKTRTDHTGASSQWMKRVRHGIAASVALGVAHAANAAPSDPVVRHMATHVMDQIVGSGSITTPGISAFDADARNQVNDPALADAKKNTVLIMSYVTTDENRRFTEKNNGVDGHGVGIEIGTGTVIEDSGIVDAAGVSHPNAILTAGHVIGLEPGIKADSDPCTLPGHRCVAFSEDGRPLGRLTLRARSAPDLNVGGTDVAKGLANDVVSMNIEPFDKRFDKIKGMGLAETLPAQIFRAEASGAYHAENGVDMPNVGVSAGFSGGGVYNAQGKLAGVLTYGFNLHTTDGKPVFYGQDSFNRIVEGNKAQDFNVNMLSVASHIKDQEKLTKIPSSEMEMLGKEIAQSGHFLPHNSIMVTPVTPDVLASLGSAGQQSYHHDRPANGESFSIVGNPIAQPLSMHVEAKSDKVLDNLLRPAVKLRGVNELEAPIIGEDGKQVETKPTPGMSPSL